MFIHGKSIIYLVTYQLRNLSISIRFINESDQIIFIEKVDFDFKHLKVFSDYRRIMKLYY